MNGIYFPGFGISLGNLPTGISIFGFEIKFYGMIIAFGFFLAFCVAQNEAKKSGQNEENYLDYLLILVIPAILGARIYYILFSLDEYFEKGKGFVETLKDLINIRNGGLAIYGGIIAGVIVAVIFTKKRKISLPLFADTISMGLLIGQLLGRWGNFFNREAFGAYTSSVFRMAIPVEYYINNGSYYGLIESGVITPEMINNTEVVNGMNCITVYPTFLFESVWNLLLLLFIFLYRRHKKYDGELAMIYLMGYGVGRFLVEGLRSDSLMIGVFKISQIVAIGCVLVSAAVMIYNRMRIKKGYEAKCHIVEKKIKANASQDE